MKSCYWSLELRMLGKTPVGVPSTWVHHMVVVAKADGGWRRVVDLSSLSIVYEKNIMWILYPFKYVKFL